MPAFVQAESTLRISRRPPPPPEPTSAKSASGALLQCPVSGRTQMTGPDPKRTLGSSASGRCPKRGRTPPTPDVISGWRGDPLSADEVAGRPVPTRLGARPSKSQAADGAFGLTGVAVGDSQGPRRLQSPDSGTALSGVATSAAWTRGGSIVTCDGKTTISGGTR